MVCSLLSASLLLQCLGDTKYGIFTSTLSIITWIYYFDMGIGNGLRNKIGEKIAVNDFVSVRKYIGVSYVLISMLAVVIFAVFFIVISAFDVEKLLNVTVDDENLNVVLLAAAFLACLNFIASLVNNILYAMQKAAMVSFYNIVAQLFYICGIYLYIRLGISAILYVAVSEGLAQLLKNVLASIHIIKKYPEFRFSLSDVEFKYANGILGFGIQMFILQIAALVLNQTDNLIILRYFGGDQVTPYNFCYKYFSVINTFITVVMTPLWSAYTAAYARKDVQWIQSTFKKSAMLYGLVFAGTIAAVIVCRPFMRIWTGRDLDFQPGLILLTAVYFLILMASHIFSTFVNGIGKVKEATVAVLIEAVINVPLSIFFAVNLGMGVNGVILGSIICVTISIIVYPYVTFRELGKMKEESRNGGSDDPNRE